MSKSESRVEDIVVNDSWLATFSDLLLLMLTFFVLRLSMSDFGTILSNAEFQKGDQQEQSEFVGEEGTEAEHAVVMDWLRGNQLLHQPAAGRPGPSQQDLELESLQEGDRIWLGSGGFVPGSAELTFRGTEVSRALGRLIAERGLGVSISVHTKSSAYLADFSSAWELSNARALVLQRQMIDAGVGSSAVFLSGYADSKPFRAVDHLKQGKTLTRVEFELVSAVGLLRKSEEED